MLHRFILTAAAFSSGVPALWAQTASVDLVPDSAVAALVLRAPAELGKRGDQIVQEAGLNLPLRPSEVVNLIENFLFANVVGVRQGFDRDGAYAAMLMPNAAGQFPDLNTLMTHFVLALPVKDRDQMAESFGFAKGELSDGKALPVKKPLPAREINFIALRGKHVFLASRQEVLEQALQGRPLAGQLAKHERDSFGTADLLICLNPRVVKKGWPEFRQELERELGRWAEDPEEKKVVAQLAKSLDDFKFLLVGARLDKGIGVQALVALDERGAAAREFLAGLRPEQPAHLHGLPRTRLAAAQAHASGARTKLLARAFADFFLKNLLETNKLTSPVDRPALLGVFNEVWQRLRGSRVGLYLTSDEARLGLFSVVAVLDTADAGEFLSELRTLAKIGDGTLDLTTPEARKEVDIAKLIADLGDDRYAVRASATTKLRLIGEPAVAELEKAAAAGKDIETVRRAQRLMAEIGAVAAERRKELLKKEPGFVRPTFSWVAQAETRRGQPVDIVHIKLKEGDAAAREAMKQYFGPDWDKVRLAVRGRQVVVLLGSETALFDETLRNLEEGKGVAAAAEQREGALARFQVSVDALASLVAGARRLPGAELPSLTLSVPASGVQLEVFVPVGELKMFVERAR